MSDPRAIILAALEESELEFRRFGEDVFEVDLPGTRKLKTTCRLEVGRHSLGVHAFVARNPDENHVGVYRWMLERNLKMMTVAFAVDAVGDIYLDGHLPLHAVTADELDRLLGTVLQHSDESFNTILELGFASSIRKEWAWREANGESTTNLKAFHRLRPDSGEASTP